jgi:hypothetical protein
MNQTEFKNKLKEVGISVVFSTLYEEDNVVISTVDRKKLHVAGASEAFENSLIQILDSNKKERKALLALEEPNRTLTNYFNLEVSYVKDFTTKTLKKQFPNLPTGTTFEVMGVSPSTLEWKVYKSPIKGLSDYRVTAHVPTSKQLFLVGYDEKHLFISCLNDKVKTVKDALASLVPKQLRGKTYSRQGEFFFKEVEKSKLTANFFKALNAFIEPGDQYIGDFSLHKQELDGDYVRSDHNVSGSVWCDTATGKQYAIGLVTNLRHKSLCLATLHEVIVANERPDSSDGMWD